MPRLSEYLQKEATAAAGTTAGTQYAAAPAGSSVVPTAAAGHVTGVDAALAAEIARLQRQHSNRLREHGPRVYRHPNGSLQPHPPAPEPLTVANRRRWQGLVKHCRMQPGVDQQLERTGVSGRYNVNTTYEQHAAAMAAIGLTPEFDATGEWKGFNHDKQDPLSSSSGGHPLAADEWRGLTQSTLKRAMEIHGQDIVEMNGWQDLWAATKNQTGPQSPAETVEGSA